MQDFSKFRLFDFVVEDGRRVLGALRGCAEWDFRDPLLEYSDWAELVKRF